MTDDEDDVIRTALRAAHAGDDPPPFRRAPAPRRSFASLVALGAVAAAAAAVAWLAWPRDATSPRLDTPVASYAIPDVDSPTDFLLTTPGAELLATTPSLSVEADVTKGATP